MKKHHPTETTFLQRRGADMKNHWRTAVLATVMSALTGTVVPMLEQWHSDKQVEQEIEAVRQASKDYADQVEKNSVERKQDTNKRLDDIDARIRSLWEKKQDKPTSYGGSGQLDPMPLPLPPMSECIPTNSPIYFVGITNWNQVHGL